MHGRRHISTDEQRLARRRHQQRKDSRAFRQRKKRRVTQFKLELPNRFVDSIVANLKSDEANPVGCRPERGWNLVWRILRSHEGIVSGGKVNWLINGLCGKGLPTIALAHVDLP